MSRLSRYPPRRKRCACGSVDPGTLAFAGTGSAGRRCGGMRR